MIALLDVNVLIALAWPNHVHHEPAWAWFDGTAPNGWATCAMTEAGFVRVSSHRGIIPEAVAPADALAVLEGLRSRARHEFWADDVELLVGDHVAPDVVVAHRQVTDAHLLALALRHRGRLATFDRRIGRLRSPEDALEVIEAG